MVNVEVVFIPQELGAIHQKLMVDSGETVAEVINQTSIPERYPETKNYAVGIFSQKTTRDAVVVEGDRIEIYRPLLIDPKEIRRARAKKEKKK